MKNTILILFCFLSLASYSQERDKPHIYLNDKEIDFDKVFINPLSIDSLFIEKKTTVGEIYIIVKKQTEFITLDSVLRNYTKLDKEQNKILFIIENKVVKSESEVLIGKSYFLKVKTKDLSEVDYLDKSLRELIIVDITLHKEKPVPEIRLRGVNSLINDIKQ